MHSVHNIEYSFDGYDVRIMYSSDTESTCQSKINMTMEIQKDDMLYHKSWKCDELKDIHEAFGPYPELIIDVVSVAPVSVVHTDDMASCIFANDIDSIDSSVIFEITNSDDHISSASISRGSTMMIMRTLIEKINKQDEHITRLERHITSVINNDITRRINVLKLSIDELDIQISNIANKQSNITNAIKKNIRWMCRGSSKLYNAPQHLFQYLPRTLNANEVRQRRLEISTQFLINIINKNPSYGIIGLNQATQHIVDSYNL